MDSDSIERSALLAAVEQTADCVVITDTSGGIRYVNPAFTQMTGYAREEAVGQHTRMLKSGRQPAAFFEDLWNTIGSGRIWEGDIINRRKDGTFYCEEMRITPVRSSTGEIACYVAIKRDVTMRRGAEQAQGWLAAMVGASKDAIVAYTPAGTIIAWNGGAERTFGWPSENAVGRHVSMLLAPDRLERLERFTEQILEGHVVFDHEGLGLHQDGSTIHVSISACPIRDSSGAVTAVSMTLADTAARRRVDEAFETSEGRFRITADSLPAMLWVTGAEGSVRFINRAYREFCGATFEEVGTGHWQLPVHPEDARQFLDAFQHAVKEGMSFSAEPRVLRADGEWRVLGLNGHPRFCSKGEFQGHVGFSSDITEQPPDDQTRQFQESIVRAILDASLDGILVVNDGNRTVARNQRSPDVWPAS